MSLEGFDYSYARPSVSAIKAGGGRFVVRYITPVGPGNKGITQAEYNALHAAGIAIAVVWEEGGQATLKGHAQGVADAKAAQANLKAIVGLSDALPVYFAVDFDATAGQASAINAYLDGAASVLGRNRVGVYGGFDQIARAKSHASWFWQTYAWSGGKVSSLAHLYQYRNGVALGGGQVDRVRALRSEYGQHGVSTAKPKPKPKAPSVPKASGKSVDKAFLERIQLFARGGGYKGPIDGVLPDGGKSWEGMQTRLHALGFYHGTEDGKPRVLSFTALQRWAGVAHPEAVESVKALPKASVKAIAKKLNTLAS